MNRKHAFNNILTSSIYLQANEVFESYKSDKTSETQSEKINEQVPETPQDVALLNSEQALVSTKEKSTKDKVRRIN